MLWHDERLNDCSAAHQTKWFFFDTNNGIIDYMETLIRKIDKNQIDEDIIEEAGKLLREGRLVAFRQRPCMDLAQMR